MNNEHVTDRHAEAQRQWSKLAERACKDAELKRRSDARISTDPDFAYLRDEIVRFRKVMAEKTYSLNEQQRATA